jgi:protocatechuate 3,4-dioxygenase beta subunit
MYFPGDPLLELDPIFQSVPEHARHLLISKFDIDITEPNFALGYRFDFILKGHNSTPHVED